MKDFPVNVFPDVERNDFKKFSKKNVTEDYIKENLRRKGWNCYAPFTDTGLDLVATKEVNGKTIFRYIQIKTRCLNDDNKFGYTLKSKDFETECRKFFFFYCDDVDDIIIISMFDYLSIFADRFPMGETHFGVPSFRNGNNKLNSLKCTLHDDKENDWKWTYKRRDEHPGGTFNFKAYVNEKGLSIMEDSKWDDDIEGKNQAIAELKKSLFYRYNKPNKSASNYELFSDGTGKLVADYIMARSNLPGDEYIIEIQNIDNEFHNTHPALYASHMRYVIDDMLRGDSNDE